MALSDGSRTRHRPGGLLGGVRPRDQLARDCGLHGRRARRHRRRRAAAAPPTRHVFAIGECALAADGRVYGLVAPGYEMAETAADDHRRRARRAFTGADLSTKLKLLGVDVASFGDAHGTTEGCLDVVYSDSRCGRLQEAGRRPRTATLLGGVLVGDAEAYGMLRAAHRLGAARRRPSSWCCPPARGAPVALGPSALPDEAVICSCHNVTKGTIRGAVTEHACTTVPEVKKCTKAGTGCGSCVKVLGQLVTAELEASGVAVDKGLCGCFAHTRAGAVRDRARPAHHHLPRAAGPPRPRGRPRRRRLRGLQAGRRLDHRLARPDDRRRAATSWTASRPRSRTPTTTSWPTSSERLVLGRAAHPRRRDHPGEADRDRRGGPRLRPLHEDHRRPADRPVRRPGRAAPADLGAAGGRRLRVRARVRQGAAHGEVLRRADLVPLRRAGLASAWPSTWSCATGACAPRTSSSRRSPAAPASARRPRRKDFGVIATAERLEPVRRRQRRRRPRATRTCSPRTSSDAELVRLIDRFLMFYIRTADRLERTSPGWSGSRAASDHVRDVVVHDSLGICDGAGGADGRPRRALPRRVGRDHQRPGAAAPGSSPSSTRPTSPTRRRLRPRARPDQARPDLLADHRLRRPHPGRERPADDPGTPETTAPARSNCRLADGWFAVCDLDAR